MRRCSAYIHFPWCLRKCPYCDFATKPVAHRDVPHARYADAVLSELEKRRVDRLDAELYSIFVGGGTPSLWDPEALGRVVRAVRAAFAPSPELEVTMEANPSSWNTRVAERFLDAGVDRVSLGVQALSDDALRFLGRLHDASAALCALSDAAKVIPRVSADLLFGLPGQRVDDVRRAIDAVLAGGIEHLSLYALTIEDRTPFGALHKKGLLPVAPDDAVAEAYLALEEHLERAGFEHYEVSNYAKPHGRARHNEHYWRGGEYVGLGAAAVGCLREKPGKGRRWRNASDPSAYMRALLDESARPEASARFSHEEFEEPLGPEELVREGLMLGLRTLDGVDTDDLAARAGVDLWGGRERALEHACERGDVRCDGAIVRVPQDRWLRLDGIVAALF